VFAFQILLKIVNNQAFEDLT